MGGSRDFLHDRRGGVAPTVAVIAMLLCGCLAVVFDVGNVFLQSRRLQGIADLAAMAAARDLANADAAAASTASLSGWPGPLAVTVTKGVYAADAALAPGQRFQPTATDANAAAVVAKGQVQLFFGAPFIGRSTVAITRRATAARGELASFSIGSRLASLHGGLANDLLSALTGSEVSLSVMDYNALAAAKVDLVSYAEALNTSADVLGASFDTALEAETTTPDALGALGDALDENGEKTAAAAARKLAAAASEERTIQLKSLVSLGPYAGQDHVAASTSSSVPVDALSLAKAILVLAQEGRQVQLDLSGSIPGISEVNVWLAIGERPNGSPWLVVTEDGSPVVRTAQMRLYLEARTLGTLQGLGVQSLRVPVLVELASAEASLAQLACPADPQAQSATLLVKPSLGQLALGDLNLAKLHDFKTDLNPGAATLLAVPGVKVSGSGRVQIGGGEGAKVLFSRTDIAAGTIKTVKSTDIAQSSLVSLVGVTQLNVSVLGLGLGLSGGPLQTSVAKQLGQVAEPLDDLLTGLTDLLGIGLGEADVTVTGLRCRTPALVA